MSWQEIHRFDQDLTLKINSWNSPFSDPFWEFMSDIPVWIPMYVMIVGLLIWRLGWKRGLMIVAAALLTFAFCDQFSNFVKEAVARLRPLKDEYMIQNGLHILENGGLYGFFSAHSANAFGLATSTYTGLRLDTRARWKGYAAFMYTWAALVGISRIFVGKHYLGDVIVGALVGLIAGYLISRLTCWVIRKCQF